MTTVAEVRMMLPWLSSGVVRCAVVLTLGWLSFGAIVAATSGAVSREAVRSMLHPFPARTIQLDQRDPCTQDPIAISARLFVTPTARVDVDVIHTDVEVMLDGWMQAGANRTERRLAIEEHLSFTRTLLNGLLGPIEVQLRLIERPYLPDTLLSARLQPFWSGSNETISVTDAHLTCD
jgi:hypothetical protein